MIIVEGADNVGKTTLVNRLMELDPSLKLLKRKRFNPRAQETIGSSYIRCLIPDDNDFIRHGYSIADRLLASECIYGSLFRGGCRMTPQEHRTIHILLNLYEAMVIWCDPPDSTIERTWKQRDQLYQEPLSIARAYRAEIHTVFKRPIIRYDWTSPNAEETLHHVVMAHAFIQDRLKDHQDKYIAYFTSLTAMLSDAIPD